ncbi:class I SAM-dependent methyltransferase [Streptomyces abikoensis]
MKANTRRDHRLAFDTVAEAYDRARPQVPADMVDSILELTRLTAGEKVLEIGAGTGQLTLPLRRQAGVKVIALEPGKTLRALLEKNTATDAMVTVRGELFEDYDGGDGPFAAVVSGNAFHWVDPRVSYGKAADLLLQNGYLVLLWNVPTVEDQALRVALNTRAFAGHPDFVRGEDPRVELLAADCVEEINASGRYEAPRVEQRRENLSFTPDDYVTLLISYANAAVLSDGERRALVEGVRALLGEHGVDEVKVVNALYAVVARRSEQ